MKRGKRSPPQTVFRRRRCGAGKRNIRFHFHISRTTERLRRLGGRRAETRRILGRSLPDRSDRDPGLLRAGARFRRLRYAAGKTSSRTVVAALAGKSVSVLAAGRIAKALGVSVESLAVRSDEH